MEKIMEKDITKDLLISLGFVKKFSTPEKDGFYYYTYEIENECVLITNCNDENDGNYTVEFFNNDIIGITDIIDLMKLIEILLKYKLK